MGKTKKIIPKNKTASESYDVVKFYENDCLLFECIPDLWFVDEEKTSCYWPPKQGKSVWARALKRELPDASWEIYNCEVVTEGLVTYSAGRNIVREKCKQQYNTSSAEDHLDAAKFRKKHPVLALQEAKPFDHVFAASETIISKNLAEKKAENSRQNLQNLKVDASSTGSNNPRKKSSTRQKSNDSRKDRTNDIPRRSISLNQEERSLTCHRRSTEKRHSSSSNDSQYSSRSKSESPLCLNSSNQKYSKSRSSTANRCKSRSKSTDHQRLTSIDSQGSHSIQNSGSNITPKKSSTRQKSTDSRKDRTHHNIPRQSISVNLEERSNTSHRRSIEKRHRSRSNDSQHSSRSKSKRPLCLNSSNQKYSKSRSSIANRCKSRSKSTDHQRSTSIDSQGSSSIQNSGSTITPKKSSTRQKSTDSRKDRTNNNIPRRSMSVNREERSNTSQRRSIEKHHRSRSNDSQHSSRSKSKRPLCLNSSNQKYSKSRSSTANRCKSRSKSTDHQRSNSICHQRSTSIDRQGSNSIQNSGSNITPKKSSTRQKSTDSSKDRTNHNIPQHSISVNLEERSKTSHRRSIEKRHRSRSNDSQHSSRSKSKRPLCLNSSNQKHSKSRSSTANRSKSTDPQRSYSMENTDSYRRRSNENIYQIHSSPRLPTYRRQSFSTSNSPARSTSISQEKRHSTANSCRNRSKSPSRQSSISTDNSNSNHRRSAEKNTQSRSTSNNPRGLIAINRAKHNSYHHRSSPLTSYTAKGGENSKRQSRRFFTNILRSDSNSMRYRRSTSSNVKRRSTASYRHSHTSVKVSQESISGVKLCSTSCESKPLLKMFTKNINELGNTIHKHNQQNDRRLTRMEVSLNKVLICLGDLTKSHATRNTPLSDNDFRDNLQDVPRRRFEIPELPITRMKYLIDFSRKIQKKEFRSFLINHEKDFCTPSKFKTNNVIMTAYLKRFVSLNVRNDIVFKDARNKNDKTLFRHFNAVYLYLIDVMIAGYKSCNKKLTLEDAHLALRVVWGRTKQTLKEQGNKRN